MIFFFLVGILSGIVFGALGSSWGAVAVPLLLLLGLDSATAKGVGLLSEIVVGVVGFFRHHSLGNVNRTLGVVLLLGAVSAFFASFLSTLVSSTSFRILLGFLEIFSGFSLLFVSSRFRITGRDGLALAALAAIISGFVKGFFGAGWGPISLMLLVLIGIPLRVVAGSSMLPTLVVTLSSSLYYIFSGFFSPYPFLLLTLGGIFGVLLGSSLHDHLPESLLRRLSGIIILVLGLLVLFERY